MKSLSERRNLIRIGQAGRTPDIGDGVPVPVRSAVQTEAGPASPVNSTGIREYVDHRVPDSTRDRYDKYQFQLPLNTPNKADCAFKIHPHSISLSGSSPTSPPP